MTTTNPSGFQWGQKVQSSAVLMNDGTYPDWPSEAPLVQSGERGEIVQVGLHAESNTRIDLVEFSRNRVVGCLEHELVAYPPSSGIAIQDGRTT